MQPYLISPHLACWQDPTLDWVVTKLSMGLLSIGWPGVNIIKLFSFVTDDEA
jgi:hypothetical protein